MMYLGGIVRWWALRLQSGPVPGLLPGSPPVVIFLRYNCRFSESCGRYLDHWCVPSFFFDLLFLHYRWNNLVFF